MARKNLAINVNGDFEANATPWTVNGGTLATVNTPAAPPWAGTKSLQFSPTGTVLTCWIVSEMIAVKAGRSYALTASMYSTAANSCAFPRVDWFDSSGSNFTTTGPGYTALATNQWVTRTANLVAPAGAVNGKFNLGITGTPTAAFLADECWITGTYALTCQAAAAPTGGDWKVTLSLSTDALATEYGSYRIQRDGVNQAFLTGPLPATWTGTQPAGTTSTWSVQLMKDVSNGSTLIVPIASASAQVSTFSSSGQTLVTNYDGSAVAWCEIQSWPEFRYTRRSATMQIMGSTNPVVTNDVALRASSTPRFLSRTTADRDALATVLSQAGPLRIQPYCSTLDAPWFMPLDFNQLRHRNDPTSGLWITEANIQHIATPSVVTGGLMSAAAQATESSEPELAA